MSEHYVVVFNFSLRVLYGRVGPFTTEVEVEKWASNFRELSRKQNLDMTAMPANLLETALTDPDKHVLPSLNPEEIILNASVKALSEMGGKVEISLAK